MGAIVDVVNAIQHGYGWLVTALSFIVAFGWIMWQIYGAKILQRDTALSRVVDMPDKLDDVQKEQRELRIDVNEMGAELAEIKNRQQIGMQVDRAQARANSQMDHEAVDKYLLENGVEPDTFLKGDEMTGFANWEESEWCDDGEDNERGDRAYD
jgi:hypothetical protein